LGGSDDKLYFTDKDGGFAGYDSSDSPDDVYINAGKTGKIWGKKFESKANEYDAMKDVSFKEGGHYGQAGYCPICDWKTTEEDWLTDIEIHLSEGHGIYDNDDRDVILRRAFESGTSDGAKKGWFDRKLANAPTVHDDVPDDTSELQNIIESLTSESSPDEVWCDLNNQWEDETSHKDHIRKQVGELKANELMSEQEMMEIDWKSIQSTNAQKAMYKQSGMPLLPNGEPDIDNFEENERWYEELISIDDYQSGGVNLWDHDTFEPVKYDEIVPDDFSYRHSTWGESKANEVDNSMDLGLLSGGIPEVNATNNEQCEVCGQLIDQDLMDYHVEQEHGLHVPSQYTQGTISQSMGDPDYDHLEDWRTSYGENKKIANEGMWDIFDDNGKCIECGQVISDNFEKRKAHLESHGINVEKEMNAPSNPDYDYHDYDEYIDDSDVPISGVYESNANELDRWDEEEKENDTPQVRKRNTGGFTYSDEEIGVNPYDSISMDEIKTLHDEDVKSGYDWQKGKESEGEDEPEYSDDIPEEDYADRKEKETWMTDESKEEGMSKAEEAFNKGASAEEIYTLVDTKESEDGRTESEDDYLNNLYNKTTANRSAGFTDLS
jgi:hypothetical protein